MRFSKILSEVPYKLRKRINKTAEGRSGYAWLIFLGYVINTLILLGLS